MSDLPAFAGTVSPVDLLAKLDGMAAELEARRTSTQGRLTSLERVAFPAGTALGGAGASFRYASNPAPVSITSKGVAAAVPLTLAAAGLDTDGKACIVQLTPSRRIVLTTDTTAVTSALFRATWFELNAGGVYVQQATTTFAVHGALSENIAVYLLHGAVRVSDTVCRGQAHSTSSNSGGNWQFSVTLDTGATSLAVTIDRKDFANDFGSNVLSRTVNTLPSGGLHRRRGHAVGQFGAVVPLSWSFGNHLGTAVWALPSLACFERVGGSTTKATRPIVAGVSANSWAFDRLTDTLFAVLSDSYVQGVGGYGAVLSLVGADDTQAGAFQGMRIGNAVAGNVRLTALSATLLVGGYTTGTQFGSYAFSRNAASNATAIVGALATNGALGTTPVEMLPISPTRFLHVAKPGATGALVATVYAVDPGAAPGASPFVQVGAPIAFTVGVGFAGAAAGDAVTIAAFEQGATGDTFEVAFKNTTRNTVGVETFAIA